MGLAIDHLRVHPVNGGKIMDELAFRLGHGRQNMDPFVGRHELGKGLFDQLNEFYVGFSEGDQVIRVHNLARVGFVQVGIDAKRLCETSVALRDLAFVRAPWYQGSLAPGWACGAAPTEDGLLNASARTIDDNRCSAWFNLWANGRSVTRLRAGMLGRKTKLAWFPADCRAWCARATVTKLFASVEPTSERPPTRLAARNLL